MNLSSNIPIYIIGAGGIVNSAHLPAYMKAGFHVVGLFDIDYNKAFTTAEKFNISCTYNSIEELLHDLPANAIVDLAVPGSEHAGLLELFPEGTSVLMQKPMGQNISDAKQILEISRRKKLNAAVNFQLRYAPFIVEARSMIQNGEIGKLNDIEVNINVYTPWHLWEFLFRLERVEILYHSVHYIDLVRSFLGNPESVYAKTIGHPLMKQLASVRTSIIMDYGEMERANILTNHVHQYGLQNQQSYIKFEGTEGAIKIELGVLKNYPEGKADKFEYVSARNGRIGEWKEKKINGSWFPDAFIGSMMQVMLAKEGKIERPDNSVEDAIYTMAVVEACYRSSEEGGVRPEV